METVFTIGDIHGEFDMFQHLLKEWNPDAEQLVLLGDLIDRGTRSKDVVELASELVINYGAIVLGGNHEDMLMDFIKEPELCRDHYLKQGGSQTLSSFFNIAPSHFFASPRQYAEALQNQFPQHLDFLSKRPDFHQTDTHIFVHAGIDFEEEDWQDTSRDNCRWIREPFFKGKNETGKTIVFGHTTTNHLNLDGNTGIWISPCQTKIGIDGGAVYGGELIGLRIREKFHYDVHSVKKNFA